MKVLTYTSYKEHCDLHTEIHGSIAINSCQIELAQKDTILLSSISVIFYKTGARTGAGNNRFIKFSLSAGTYSIDGFNAKIKAAVLQQRQDWVPPQIKDLGLVIPEHCTFMASNIFFIALGIQDKHLEKTTLIKSTLPPWIRQINKVKNELDGQPSSLLSSMHVSNYKATFSPTHLVFLELDTHRHYLDFKILDESNNKVILRTLSTTIK